MTYGAMTVYRFFFCSGQNVNSLVKSTSFDKLLRFIVLEVIQMDEIGNSDSAEIPELTETLENINNNKIPEEKMAALYATVIKKNIYEEYDEEYGVKPIFILESDIFGSHKPNPQEFITHNMKSTKPLMSRFLPVT